MVAGTSMSPNRYADAAARTAASRSPGASSVSVAAGAERWASAAAGDERRRGRERDGAGSGKRDLRRDTTTRGWGASMVPRPLDSGVKMRLSIVLVHIAE